MLADAPTMEAILLAAEAARSAPQAQTNGHVPGVYRAIVAVSADIAKVGIAKDSRNVQQNYAFRGIDAVMNALAPLLAKHRLVILPRMISRDVVERQAKSGGTLFYVTVEMEFDFVCAVDGSTHTVRMFGEAMDSADKATNKAASASYKYAACQAFCIPTEGDADETTHEMLSAPVQPSASRAHGVRADEQAAAPGRVAPNVSGDSGRSSAPAPQVSTAEPPVDARDFLPNGAVLIMRVDHTPTKNSNVTKYLLTTSTGETFSTIKDRLAAQAKTYMQDREPVRVTGTRTRWGMELETLAPADSDGPVYETDDERVPF